MTTPMVAPDTASLRRRRGVAARLVSALALAGMTQLGALDAASVPAETGISAGLCVHVGARDGGAAIALARDGRMLVHALAPDPALVSPARSAIQRAGRYGLASIEPLPSLARLPHADRIVNLLIIDDLAVAAKAGFTLAEALRVLVPKPYGAVAVLANAGAAQGELAKLGVAAADIREVGGALLFSVARPAGMDDWTHDDHGPDGNALSRDTGLGIPTNYRWITGRNNSVRERSPGLRIAQGRLAQIAMPGLDKRNRRPTLTTRDSFNGVALWELPFKEYLHNSFVPFFMGGGLVFFVPEDKAPMSAYDADTGKVVRTYEQGARYVLPSERPYMWQWNVQMFAVYDSGLLLQTQGNKLFVLDAASGALKRTYEAAAGKMFTYVSTDGSGKRAFVAEGGGTSFVFRWPKNDTYERVHCFDLTSSASKPLWTSTALGGRSLSQIIHADGRICLFSATAIGASDKKENAQVALLSASDGKTIWQQKYEPVAYNAIVRDDAVLFGSSNVYHFALADGKLLQNPGFRRNQACGRFAASLDHIIFGSTTFLDRAGSWTYFGAARAGCATGPYLANGLTMFSPNDFCGCLTYPRAYTAFTSAPLRAPVADGARLDRAFATLAVPAVPAGALAAPTGPVTVDWRDGEPFTPYVPSKPGDPTKPQPRPLPLPPPLTVSVGGVDYQPIIHEQRIEARRGTDVLWTAYAGGRVMRAPVVQDGLCWFGSQDGYVTCVAGDTGKPVWRFLAAPTDERIVVYGQVESPWPVPNVVMHQGAICCVAGRSAEVGGGLYAYGLDPKTGALRWKLRFHAPSWSGEVAKKDMIPDLAGRPVAVNRVLNDLLEPDEAGALRIRTLHAKASGGYTFTPPAGDGGTIDPRVRAADPGKKR